MGAIPPFVRSRAWGRDAVPSDAAFDSLLPGRHQAHSYRHWTPAGVAATAARWLTEESPSRPILDVGAGAGKFCIVGALTTRARFVGIEDRPALVDVARSVATTLGVHSRVDFRHGRVSFDELSRFSRFYLFNPFAEGVHEPAHRIDDTVQRSHSRFCEDVELVHEAFWGASKGARVVTYHGFGGTMPRCFQVVREAPHEPLKLWVKR